MKILQKLAQKFYKIEKVEVEDIKTHKKETAEYHILLGGIILKINYPL